MEISEILTTTKQTDFYQIDQFIIKELDMSNSVTVTDHYRGQNKALSTKCLILDLENINYIDSSGIGCLISLQIKDYGPEKLILTNVKGKIWNIFIISGIENKIHKAENLKEAISQI